LGDVGSFPFPEYSKLVSSGQLWSALVSSGLDRTFSAVARNLRSAVATKAKCSPTLAAHFTAVTLAENGATPKTHPVEKLENDTLDTLVTSCDIF